MKMIKAMKKLKFWPRIKKRKKNPLLLTESSPPRPPPSRPPPPPPPYNPIHSQYEPLLPSAPPLPPWLEYDIQFQETHSITPSADHDENSIASKPHLSPPRDEETSSREILCNQEYVVNEKTVVPQLMKLEKGSGAFGCAVGFGTHLVRCVFPCFHIREEVSL